MADPISASTIAASGGESTKFYELSGIMLSLIQMIVYYILYDKYVDRLEDLAKEIGDGDDSWGAQEEAKYRIVRGWDVDFYNWYDEYFAKPYTRCEVDVLRAKGAAYHTLGNVMRLARSVNRGYTPLAMVAHASRNVIAPLVNVSYNRALGHFNEERRIDVDLLNRWDSNVSRPVLREGQGVGFTPIIDYLTKGVDMFGRGFNSAGVAFGNALYQYLRK